MNVVKFRHTSVGYRHYPACRRQVIVNCVIENVHRWLSRIPCSAYLSSCHKGEMDVGFTNGPLTLKSVCYLRKWCLKKKELKHVENKMTRKEKMFFKLSVTYMWWRPFCSQHRTKNDKVSDGRRSNFVERIYLPLSTACSRCCLLLYECGMVLPKLVLTYMC